MAPEESIIAARKLPDGRVLYVVPLLFGQARLCVAPDGDARGYDQAY